MKYVGVIFLLAILSCKNEPIIYPDGGYAFINTDTIKDKSFPYFPVKDSFFSKDSLRAVLIEASLMNLFDDKNISLKATEKEIFRLYVSSGFNPYYSFTLTDSKLIAKKGEYNRRGNTELNLTELEEFQFDYLEMNFPLINGTRKKPLKVKWKHYADSLLYLYPKMGDVEYYKYLFNKAYPIKKNEFSYETKIILLSYKTYKNLIEKINNSGYWKMPIGLECNDGSTDGIGFSLEANNGTKYNIVGSKICIDTSNNFTKACQEIINYAHYEDEITIDYKASQHK
jgi:hypothetical protein